MSAENVAIVRRLFEAVARRDTEEVLSIYDPDVDWDGTAHPWASVLGSTGARFRGHEALREWWRRYTEAWTDLEENLEDLIDAGDTVVAIVTTRARGRTSGLEVEWRENYGVFELREGRVIRVTWTRSREDALAAAGLERADG